MVAGKVYLFGKSQKVTPKLLKNYSKIKNCFELLKLKKVVPNAKIKVAQKLPSTIGPCLIQTMPTLLTFVTISSSVGIAFLLLDWFIVCHRLARRRQ